MKTKSVKFIYAVLAMFVAAMLIFFAAFASGCIDNGDGEQASGSGMGGNFEEDVTDEDFMDEVVKPEEDSEEDSEEDYEERLPEGLIINLSEITSTPKFFRTTLDGVNYQVIAAKVNGTYRTAFDTCRNCNHHYILQGTTLKCGSCGFSFSASQLGNSFNGCGPIAITAANRVVTDTVLIIPNTYLSSNVSLFRYWIW